MSTVVWVSGWQQRGFHRSEAWDEGMLLIWLQQILLGVRRFLTEVFISTGPPGDALLLEMRSSRRMPVWKLSFYESETKSTIYDKVLRIKLEKSEASGCPDEGNETQSGRRL